uniref:Uncharacterized protein n=1 Tax=Opuntia streptacantha TaxID=393608 RepID=A0A7C8ZCQ7_OPUST
MHIRLFPHVNLEGLLCIPYQPFKVHRQRPRVVTSSCYLSSKLISICFKLLNFSIKYVAELPNGFQIIYMFFQHIIWFPVIRVKLISICRIKLRLLHLQRVQLLGFYPNSIHAIFTVKKLDDISQRIPHCSIIFNHNVLHSFNQPPLYISSLRSFDGSINQTFPTTHGMEKELLRGQPSQI